MNTLDKFLEEHGVHNAYQFHKATGLPEATARRLYKNRDVFPDKETIMKICQAFNAQPGEFLAYAPVDVA
jgi:DNA-binding Xre family transcriptional regulator